MLKKFSLFVGLNKKDGGRFSRRKGSFIIIKTAASFGFDALTLRPVVGVWKGKKEQTFEVLLYVEEEEEVFVEELGRVLARDMSQECVLFESEKGVQFLEPAVQVK